MNSRLDTLQAEVLQVKLKAFRGYELKDTDRIAARYEEELSDCVKVPKIPEGYSSGWAQYSILLKDGEERGAVQEYLKEHGVPTTIYYPRGMHQQTAFAGCRLYGKPLTVPTGVCQRVRALPSSQYVQ